jgi:hypothetical protein
MSKPVGAPPPVDGPLLLPQPTRNAVEANRMARIENDLRFKKELSAAHTKVALRNLIVNQ